MLQGNNNINEEHRDHLSPAVTTESSWPGDISTASFNLLGRFVDDYGVYAKEVLRPTQRRLEEILTSWREPDYWSRNSSSGTVPASSPVQQFRTRVKKTKDVIRKILAKPNSFPDGLVRSSLDIMYDTLGARLVVYFLSGLPMIDREIREGGLFEISPDEPPHAYLDEAAFKRLGLKIELRSKASGYASIHYVLRLDKKIDPYGERPWFELQLRTLTQDMWAELEHLLGYKHNATSSQTQGQFQLISRLLSALDEHFDYLRADLEHRQRAVRPRDEEPLSTENFPGVLSESGISCSQYDIEGLLKTAAGCDIVTVRDLRETVTPEHIETVCAAARNTLGRKPSEPELILSLLMLFGRRHAIDPLVALKRWTEFERIIKGV